jgi:hypothetical protein
MPKKNLAAVAAGRLGGKKGSVARSAASHAWAALTPEERSELGKKAAAARWKKYWQ